VNNAVEQTIGDVVCLCDANVMFELDTLDNLVATLSDPNVGAVIGDVILFSTERNLDAPLGKFRFGRLCDVIQQAEVSSLQETTEVPA
jgi:cellulose synthase/poly-beta-1,6-N-acetylglucosamine synthase-like glycosyltransferase